MRMPALSWPRSLEPLRASGGLINRVGWATAGLFGTQVVRFGTNLILTRLLAPEFFGIMVLLTSLRVGLELFTDIGINQNVIASPNANNPRFYNTAWTLQIIRGALLSLVALAILPFLHYFYDKAELTSVLPFITLFFLMAGFSSVGYPLAIKALNTKRTSLIELLGTTVGSLLMIGAAMASPNVWGLLAGNLLATLGGVVFSYWMTPGLKYAFRLNREDVWEIIGLGKWIFITSIIFFLATNFDRLALARYTSFAALGVYGLARSLCDAFAQFSGKIGSAIIFPGVASTELAGPELRAKLSHRRSQFLGIALFAVAGLAAGSDFIVGTLYDDRYFAAASALPWLALATWVGTLNTINENVLLGLRHAHYMASANGAKLVVLVAALPYGLIHYGIIGAAIATILAELARYVVLAVGQERHRLGFFGFDLAATAAVLLVTVGGRLFGHAIGLTGPLDTLFQLNPIK